MPYFFQTRSQRELEPQKMQLEEWNPMAAAYDNKTFNRYTQGIGRDLSGSGKHNTGLSLYVQNIPFNLGKEGFYNLFAEYGTVLDCNLMKPNREKSATTVGFVSMQSMVDAQKAIAKLDGKQIGRHTLRVSPALTEEEKKNRKQMKERENEILGSIGRDGDKQEYGASVGRQSNKPARPQFQSGRSENVHHVPSTGLTLDKGDWHSLSKAAEERSRMVPKLAISIGSGNRQVQEKGTTIPLPKENLLQSLGRGRSSAVNFGRGRGVVINSVGQPYNGPGLLVAPTDHHNVPWQPRGSGRGIFQPPSQSQRFSIVSPPQNARVQSVKACLFCRKSGCVNRCARCKLYYCSAECQKNDWANHKDICMTIGEQYNGHTDPSFALAQNQNYSQKEFYETDFEQPQHLQNRDRGRNGRNYDSDTAKRASDVKEVFKFGQKKIEPGQSRVQNNSKTQDKKPGEKNSFGRRENEFETDIREGTSPCTYAETQKKDKSLFMKDEGNTKKQRGSANQKAKFKNSPKKRINLDQGIDRKQDQWDLTSMSDKTGSTDDECFVTKSAADSSNKVVELELSVKFSGQGYLTYFESPNKFWMCLPEHLEAFTDTMVVMAQEMKLSPATTVAKPKVGSMYGVNYSGDWCRAKVISVQKDEAKVLFVDYGNEDLVKVKDMRLLSLDVIKLPAQAICCCVSKVKPKGTESWSKSACEAVRDWFGEPMTKYLSFEVVSKRGQVHAVKISRDNEAVTEMLISKGFAERSTGDPGLPNLNKAGASGSRATASRIMAKDIGTVAEECKKGEKIPVILTHIETVDRFAAHIIASQRDVAQLSALLEKEYLNISSPYRPVVGELVAAKFSGDSSWYRAKVTGIEGDSFRLLFIDYGNSELQAAESIQPLTNTKLNEIPAQALLCGLFGVESSPDITSEKINEEFKNLLIAFCGSDAQCLLIIKDMTDDQLLVDMLSESGLTLSHALNKKLAETSITLHCQVSPKSHSMTSPPSSSQPSKNAQAPSKVSKGSPTDLSAETLPSAHGENTSVNVCFVKSCSEFYVKIDSNEKKFISMMKDLNEMVESTSRLSSPSVGCLAAVQYSLDHIWYRGKVRQINGEKCEILFIDFGNTETVQVSALRELPQSSCSLPAQAIKCRLDGKPETSSKEAHDEFKQYLENEKVDVKVLGSDSRGFTVQMYALDGTNIHSLFCDAQGTDKTAPEEKTIPSKIPNVTLDKSAPVKVECVNMISPLEFYVQISEYIPTVVEATLRLKTRLELNPQPLRSLSIGDFVASKFSQDSDVIWYRVRVDKVDGNRCSIFFVDYGIFEETDVSGLMRLAEEDFLLPACTVKCRLNGCVKSSPELDRAFAAMGQSQIDSISVVNQGEDECIVDVLGCDGNYITNKFTRAALTPLKPEHISPLKPPSAKSSPKEKTPIMSISREDLPHTEELVPVTVSHVDSCWQVYVSRKDEHLQSELLQLMISLNESADSLPVLANPSSGSICVARYSQDGSWYRARLDAVCSASTCVVQFIDYGNAEETSLSELREIKPDLTQLPAQAIRCCLQGYESKLSESGSSDIRNSISSDEKEKLQGTLLEQSMNVKVVDRKGDTWIIKMENEQGECISGKFMPQASAPCISSTPNLSDLIYESPPEKEFDAIFCHVNNLSEFYCQRNDPEEIKELLSMGEMLKEDVSKTDAKIDCEPVVGGVFVSEFLGSWYRCVVCEVCGPKVQIRYIDYGNCEEIRASELWPLHPQRLSMPVRLIKCKLHGVEPVTPDWKDSEMEQYMEILTQQHPRLAIHGEEEDSFLVSLSAEIGDGSTLNVAEDLVSIGMARSTTEGAEVGASEKGNPTSSAGTQQHQEMAPVEEGDDDDDEELELQQQIEKLQRQLELTKMKKSKVPK